MRKIIILFLLVSASFAAVRNLHPRVLMTQDIINNLKSRRAANTAEWQRIDERCNAYWNWTGEEIINDYITQYEYIRTYALGFYATDSMDYMTRAVDILMAFCRLTTVSDIEFDSYYRSRSYLPAMAHGYDLCYNYMTSAQRDTIRTRIIAWADGVKSGGYARFGSLYYEPGNNYAAGHCYGVGTAGYAIVSENTTKGNEYISWADSTIDDMIGFWNTRLKGGDANEGWSYGSGYGMNTFLYVATKTTADSPSVNKFSSTTYDEDAVDFLIYATLPDNEHILPNGDWARESTGLLWSQHRTVADIVSTFSDNTKSKQLARYWGPIASPTSEEHNFYVWRPFLLYNYEGTSLDYTTTTPFSDTLYTFTDSSGTGQFIQRTGWTTSDTWVSFRAGGMYGDHAHNGNGHFEIWKNGWLIIDDNIKSSDGLGIPDYAHNCIQFPTVSDSWNLPGGDYANAVHAAIPYRDFTSNYSYIWENSDDIYAGQADNTSTKAERRFLYIPEADLIWTFDIANTTTSTTDVQYRVNYNGAITASGGDWYYSNGTSRINTHCAYPTSGITGTIANGAYSGATNTRLDLQYDTASSSKYFVVAHYINSAFLTEQDINIADGYGSAIVKADTTYLAMFTDGLSGDINFTANDNVKTKYYIDGITPSTTYYVTNTDNGTTRTINISTSSSGSDFSATSSSQGLLYFTSNGQSQPIKDTTPPTGTLDITSSAITVTGISSDTDSSWTAFASTRWDTTSSVTTHLGSTDINRPITTSGGQTYYAYWKAKDDSSNVSYFSANEDSVVVPIGNSGNFSGVQTIYKVR